MDGYGPWLSFAGGQVSKGLSYSRNTVRQVTLWDLSLERDEEAELACGATAVDTPPQLLFIHQGQHDVKEVGRVAQLCYVPLRMHVHEHEHLHHHLIPPPTYRLTHPGAFPPANARSDRLDGVQRV
jgi:hypothetical protein